MSENSEQLKMLLVAIPGPRRTIIQVEVPENDPILSRPNVRVLTPGDELKNVIVSEEVKKVVSAKDAEIEKLKARLALALGEGFEKEEKESGEETTQTPEKPLTAAQKKAAEKASKS